MHVKTPLMRGVENKLSLSLCVACDARKEEEGYYLQLRFMVMLRNLGHVVIV